MVDTGRTLILSTGRVFSTNEKAETEKRWIAGGATHAATV